MCACHPLVLLTARVRGDAQVVLCNLVNALKPGTIKKISTKQMPFMQMENIAAYLSACNAAFAIETFESFMTVDLYEDKNMGAVVLNLHALGRATQSLAGYAGPTLGAKVATSNRRDFTEE